MGVIKEFENAWYCPNCKELMKKSSNDSNIYLCEECNCYVDVEDIKFYQEKEPEVEHTDDKIGKGKSIIYKLFNKRFMKKYTKFTNFNEFILKSDLLPKNIKIIDKDLFNQIGKDELNEYIKHYTEFNSWDEMFDKATSRYIRF